MVVKTLLKYPVLLILLTNLLGLVFFEGAARVLAYHGIMPYRHFPTSEQRTLLDDINPHFGVWRFPNKNVQHSGPCFDVTYKTNSAGMRDNEKLYDSKGVFRIAVLGDSFVEGYGVEEQHRLTEVVEDQSAVETLNFGTSGDFSSTQQYLVYKHLASKFEHEAIALFFLPANDFRDNDPRYFDKKRYRPYLKRNANDSFEIYYTIPFHERKKARSMSAFRSFRRTLYNQSYLLNGIRQLGDIFEGSDLKDSITDPFLTRTKTSYDDYTTEDLKKLVWGYQQIAKASKNKPLHIFIIPREVDFLEAENGVETRLFEELQARLAHLDSVHVHDLLPGFQKLMKERNLEHDDLFLSCDGHWSSTGHQLAAHMMMNAIRVQ